MKRKSDKEKINPSKFRKPVILRQNDTLRPVLLTYRIEKSSTNDKSLPAMDYNANEPYH